jgi:hypothetical protein
MGLDPDQVRAALQQVDFWAADYSRVAWHIPSRAPSAGRGKQTPPPQPRSPPPRKPAPRVPAAK